MQHKFPVKLILLLLMLVSFNAKAEVKEKIIAIFDFDNNSFMDIERFDYLQRILPEMLLAQLKKIPGIRMIERVQLKAALEELKLGAGDLADKDSQLKLGKILGAQNMMFGSYMVNENQVRMDVRVAQVETSLILMSEGEVADLDNLMPTVKLISDAVASKLGIHAQAKMATGASQEVWKLYDKGIVLMDAKKYEEAVEVFKQVLQMDPKFDIAEQRIVEALNKLESM